MTARIAVIGMGGSISTVGRHPLDLYEYGQHARPLQVGEVLEMFAEVLGGFDIVPVPFRALDSAAADPALWLELNREITRVAGSSSVDGIVVLHGTSTLEETAYFLHLAAKVDAPIVLTGSQRPPNALGSDAGINIVNALRVAADAQARGAGVLVVMNDEIQCAREVTKASNFSLHAFRTPDFGVLGHVGPDGSVSMYRRPTRRHAPDTEFDVLQLDTLPAVEVAYSYAGASGRAIAAFVEDGVRGCIAPRERPWRWRRRAPCAEQAKGALVVQCSRAGSGRVVPRGDDLAAGFIGADDLNGQKARILAMLALTQASDRDAVRKMFATY
jgi:L-asparaginase